MGKVNYKAQSLKETQSFAQQYIQEMGENRVSREGAFVVALQGELGSGKTSFVQGAARALGVQESVLSPTFLIVKSYPISSLGKTLYHIDCYRVQDSKDLLDLGWQEIVENPNNIVFLEWPERVRDILPQNAAVITFEATGKEQRIISIVKKA